MSKPLESRRGQGRLAAMRFLYEWRLNPSEDLQEAMTLQFGYLKVKTGIAGYARQLIEGTLKHQEQIDKVVSENLTNWNLERLAVVERSILSIAVYEMLYMHEVPTKVTINEMVEVAKEYGSVDSPSFVNGVLDGIRKKFEPDSPELEEEEGS
jgi:transcription antitermination protein NusB